MQTVFPLQRERENRFAPCHQRRFHLRHSVSSIGRTGSGGKKTQKGISCFSRRRPGGRSSAETKIRLGARALQEENHLNDWAFVAASEWCPSRRGRFVPSIWRLNQVDGGQVGSKCGLAFSFTSRLPPIFSTFFSPKNPDVGGQTDAVHSIWTSTWLIRADRSA